MTPPDCTLGTSLYFVFTGRYPSRFDFVKTSLLWENDADCPVLIGITILSSDAMQKGLPDNMMNAIIKELDERNTGNGSFNASHVMQLIQTQNLINPYYIIYVDQATLQILIHYKI